MSAAVVVGSGSAGRRHLGALLAERPGLRVTVVRRAGAEGLDEAMAGQATKVVQDLDAALEDDPVLGIVASPAPHHPLQIGELLRRGATVLAEKPLAADLAAGRDLLAVDGVGQRVVVGYHLRFGDVAPALRAMIDDGAIGVPQHADLFVGQHLSDWRPGTDPRSSVSARHELGGGVLLELSHELDALRFVLDDEVEAVLQAHLERGGAPTDGIVDTVAELRLRMAGGVDATVHLDMVRRPARRVWRFRGTGGSLIADLLAGEISLVDAGGGSSVVATFDADERSRAESRLIRHLLDVEQHGAEPRCGIADGLAALAVVEAARRCAAEGARVDVPVVSVVP